MKTARRSTRRLPVPRKSEGRGTTSTYVWRRLHGDGLIAEAAPVPGMGLWRASGYPVGGRSDDAVYGARALSLLTEAHDAADDLVRKEFRHVCQIGVCGRWLRWREDDSQHA